MYKFRNSYRLNNSISRSSEIERKTGFENESSSGHINRDVSRYIYEMSHFHGEQEAAMPRSTCRKARSFKCEISLPCDKC